MNSEITLCLETVSQKLNTDIIIYNGEINLQGADSLIEITYEPKNSNVLFLLCTPGGDAHSAFKIARRLQEKYANFYLYVYGYCKSAGTLIAIGSDEIIMSDYAEFGPLDVQLQEKDEIWRYSSGLNINESLRTFRIETLHFFRSTLMELTAAAGISTKTAAELATKLAIGFISPIVSQIDPVRVGEVRRAVNIALAYGEKLINNRGNLNSIKELAALVQEYPDHGFVIDFKEAQNIFKKVRKHNHSEEILGVQLKELIKHPSSEGILIERVYPLGVKNESSYKSTDIERAKSDQGKARKTNSTDCREVLQIR